MSRHVDYEEGYHPGDVVVGYTSLWRKKDFDWTIEKLLPKRRVNTYRDEATRDYVLLRRDHIVVWSWDSHSFARMVDGRTDYLL